MKLNRVQLIILVRDIVEARGSEQQIDEWVALLKSNVADPAVTDLIFYSDPPLTPEEVVDKAMSYKAIRL